MESNYTAIIQQTLDRLYALEQRERARAMGAHNDQDRFKLKAFGASCCITPAGITLDDREQNGPLGVILSLYALNATAAPLAVKPLKAFKEFPDSMPYVGAFTSHTEKILTGAVHRIIRGKSRIMDAMDGSAAPAQISGDSAMLLRPLPKIALCYIFYEADEDFPASATCLYSNNACHHMPMDGLADIGEYTSRRILELIKEV
jgi:hypothetical protein